MIHIDSKTIDGLDFRISVSNIFSQVKTTNLSLHLPYVNPAVGAKQQNFILKKGTGPDIRDSMNTENLEHSNWTLLRLDMPNLISMHSRHKHRHICRIQLCSNLRIAGVFTSDLEYSPLINRSTRPQLANKGVREFPLPQDVLPNASDIPLPIDIIKLPDVLPTELVLLVRPDC
ncbi:unnamed protein product [Calicophoron daubneyi]|uniref:Uncharacterized protein n=1 Tax=Calicophoron daubneyi TaxID=300641 RepID=A0AAV2TZ03_CALDB